MSRIGQAAELGLAVAEAIRATGRRVRWQPQITYSVVIVGQVAPDDYHIRLQPLGRIWVRESGLQFLDHVPEDAAAVAHEAWRAAVGGEQQLALPLEAA